ncbi:DUF6286 domain-containing protein [Microtetraspora sp. NBRC 16547]|uniref:DUF6286 domain-containing protein n=1 Tax=Microtetraspora sp. NBRC 16547 TaxID=3030993 RepID=UPI0024A2FC52|nr:DUF6286 domain-containing protein [Microtetraspora sp. NBRC 16547]GLX01294.1 hypothetical protein Misp02_53800 [Microtetraspora sp. NBRC 16547]
MSIVEDILAASPAAGVRTQRRTLRRNAIRALRPGRTPAGVMVSASLAMSAWTVLAVIVGGLFGAPADPRLGRLLSLTLGDPVVRSTASAMIVVGAVLVALALIPGRPRLVAVETTDPLLVIGLTRSGLRRTLSGAARGVEGVEAAYVRIHPRRIEVTVVTRAQGTGELLRAVGTSVGDRLSGLGVQSRQDVVVRLRRARV